MASKHANNHDHRIHTSYERLVKLQSQVQSFSLLPHLVAQSQMSGRHGSPFRGRGLNFEELRHYQMGDDIRNLDWKVTMRTGKPHVRTYTEEKDRNFILCVDQRSGMYFSSVDTMKSVVASEIAALSAWRILKDNDRVGFIISRSNQIEYLKPQRSQNHLLHALKRLNDANHTLDIASEDSERANFSSTIRMLGNLALKNATILFISDWSGATEFDLDRLKYLQQHNDILSVVISDPLEAALPADILDSASLVFGDGKYQLSVTEKTKLDKANQGLKAHAHHRLEKLGQLMAMKRLPVIELSTDGQHIDAFKRAVGGFTS
ncbi:DUF58 domain-containing protein [Vibrio sp. DNB22_10_4]